MGDGLSFICHVCLNRVIEYRNIIKVLFTTYNALIVYLTLDVTIAIAWEH